MHRRPIYGTNVYLRTARGLSSSFRFIVRHDEANKEKKKKKKTPPPEYEIEKALKHISQDGPLDIQLIIGVTCAWFSSCRQYTAPRDHAALPNLPKDSLG